MKKKIIGFGQLRNESENGNLENWFRCMEPCDHIYIFDQASTDNSREIYEKYKDKTTVIYSPTNRFKEELICKAELYEMLLKEQPDVDWVLWLDGDILLDGRLLVDDNLQRLCNKLDGANVDLPCFGHYNLWRSDVHYRVDNGYHNLHGHWFPLWGRPREKNIPRRIGLHHGQIPEPNWNPARVDVSVIHRGFVSDANIVNKYNMYKFFGQTGWDLDRLIDESTLTVEKLPDGILPDWFEIEKDTDPTSLTPLVE
jgi:glycosyltransferase involved in cell wall biosynthesis